MAEKTEEKTAEKTAKKTEEKAAEKPVRTAFVIAEFNPFHNGHAAILRKAREKADADFVCVVLSGDFVQRGEPAIAEKYTRTRMALMNGADVVFELPLYYSLGSAEFFARGAISLMNRLGVCDALVFGSECADIERLRRVADLLNDETPSFKMNLQLALKRGSDYPTARAKALAIALPEEHRADVELLDEPNNLLAIEYLRRMKKTKASFEALTVKRTSGVSSAQIRTSILAPHGRMPRAKMPEVCAVLLNEYTAHGGYVFGDPALLAERLAFRLAFDSSKGVSSCADVSDELASRIYKNLPAFSDLPSFIDLLHTKDMTEARVKRALMHILLQMSGESLLKYTMEDTVYARVLGFRKDAQPLLNKIKSAGKIPLITKLAQSQKLLADDPQALRLLQEDIRASLVYDQCFLRKEAYPLKSEFEKQIVTM